MNLHDLTHEITRATVDSLAEQAGPDCCLACRLRFKLTAIKIIQKSIEETICKVAPPDIAKKYEEERTIPF